MTSVTARRATTPRPSISPLSTTSKPRAPQQSATRDTMADDSGGEEEFEFDNAIDTADAEVGENEDDRSSSLSDPEDDNDDPEEQDDEVYDVADGEELAAQRSLEVDSEAETERLDQTPQKSRKHADSVGRTPSKLSQAATAEEDLSEPPSPLPLGAGAASSTSTVATVGESHGEFDCAVC